MSKTRAVSFAEFQRLLTDLGFKEKPTAAALVFHRPKEGLLAFRVYKADETVDQGDLLSTRRFLDFRGLLQANDFDAFLGQASTPA